MSTVRCRCGKTRRVRRHGKHWTCQGCCAKRNRCTAATAVLSRLVARCHCPRRQFPGYETPWERELLEADELFRSWKDLGCPADHLGAALLRLTQKISPRWAGRGKLRGEPREIRGFFVSASVGSTHGSG